MTNLLTILCISLTDLRKLLKKPKPTLTTTLHSDNPLQMTLMTDTPIKTLRERDIVIRIVSDELLPFIEFKIPRAPEHRWVDEPIDFLSTDGSEYTCPHCDKIVKGDSDFWCHRYWHPDCLDLFQEEWSLHE